VRFDKTVVLAAAAVATFGIFGSVAGSTAAQASPAPAAVASVTASVTVTVPPVPVPPATPDGNDPWD
jgi:hypothetical protein